MKNPGSIFKSEECEGDHKNESSQDGNTYDGVDESSEVDYNTYDQLDETFGDIDYIRSCIEEGEEREKEYRKREKKKKKRKERKTNKASKTKEKNAAEKTGKKLLGIYSTEYDEIAERTVNDQQNNRSIDSEDVVSQNIIPVNRKGAPVRRLKYK